MLDCQSINKNQAITELIFGMFFLIFYNLWPILHSFTKVVNCLFVAKVQFVKLLVWFNCVLWWNFLKSSSKILVSSFRSKSVSTSKMYNCSMTKVDKLNQTQTWLCVLNSLFWLLWLSSAQEYLPSGVLFVSRSVVDSAKTSSFCRIMRNITLMPHKDHVRL